MRHTPRSTLCPYTTLFRSSPYGEVTRATGFLTRATLEGDVALATDVTAYASLGDWPLLASALLALGLAAVGRRRTDARSSVRSEEHTSELQSLRHLVCRLL